MTGISKNLLRFSSLLVAVAMFLGLAVAGCGDEGSKDGASVTPFDETAGKVVFKMFKDATAARGADLDKAIDAYAITAFDESGDVVATQGFAAPDSQMAGVNFWTESGEFRVNSWVIKDIESLNISQFRVDFMKGTELIGSAFIVEDSPLTVAGKTYTEDAKVDGFSVVKAEDLQGNLAIFVGSEEPVTELEAGQIAPVSALFTYTVGENVFVQNAEVELEETEVATLEEDSVGQVLVAADEVAEPTDVTLTSEVEGAEAVYVVTIVPAASKAEIVFSNADVETMTAEDELASLDVAVTTDAETPVVNNFKVWEKVAAEEDGAEPTYTEVAVDTTDYVVAIAEDDTTGSSVLTEDTFALQSGETAGETSIVVTRTGEENPAATLTVNVLEPQLKLVFSEADVVEMDDTQELTEKTVDDNYTWNFAVWQKQYIVVGEEEKALSYAAVSREDCSAAYNCDEGVGALNDSAWTVENAGAGPCVGTVTATINDTDITGSLDVTINGIS